MNKVLGLCLILMAGSVWGAAATPTPPNYFNVRPAGTPFTPGNVSPFWKGIGPADVRGLVPVYTAVENLKSPTITHTFTQTYTPSPSPTPTITSTVTSTATVTSTYTITSTFDYLVRSGVAGGQTAIGGTASGNNLKLEASSHSTPGWVDISSTGKRVKITDGKAVIHVTRTNPGSVGSFVEVGQLYTTNGNIYVHISNSAYDVSKSYCIPNYWYSAGMWRALPYQSRVPSAHDFEVIWQNYNGLLYLYVIRTGGSGSSGVVDVTIEMNNTIGDFIPAAGTGSTTLPSVYTGMRQYFYNLNTHNANTFYGKYGPTGANIGDGASLFQISNMSTNNLGAGSYAAVNIYGPTGTQVHTQIYHLVNIYNYPAFSTWYRIYPTTEASNGSGSYSGQFVGVCQLYNGSLYFGVVRQAGSGAVTIEGTCYNAGGQVYSYEGALSFGGAPTTVLYYPENYTHTLKTMGGFSTALSTKSAAYTMTYQDHTINVNGNYNITLPSAARPGCRVRLNNVGSSNGSFSRAGSDGIVANGTVQNAVTFKRRYEYYELEADGNTTWAEVDHGPPMYGGAKVWNDFQYVLAQGKVPATNAPTWSAFGSDHSAYTFADGDYIDAGVQELPHGYAEGTTIHPHIHWATNGTDVDERAVKWQLVYSFSNTDSSNPYTQVFTAPATLSKEVTVQAGVTALSHIYTDFGEIPLTTAMIGGELMVRLRRITAAGTAPSNNPYALQVGVHFEQDTVGSNTEEAK